MSSASSLSASSLSSTDLHAALAFRVPGSSHAALLDWLKKYSHDDWSRVKTNKDRFSAVRIVEDTQTKWRQESGEGEGKEEEEEETTVAAPTTRKRQSRSSVGYVGGLTSPASPRVKTAGTKRKSTAGRGKKKQEEEEEKEEEDKHAEAEEEEEEEEEVAPKKKARVSKASKPAAKSTAAAAKRRVSTKAAKPSSRRTSIASSVDEEEEEDSSAATSTADADMSDTTAARPLESIHQPASRMSTTTARKSMSPPSAEEVYVDSSLFSSVLPVPSAAAAVADVDVDMRASPSPSPPSSKFEVVSPPPAAVANPFQLAQLSPAVAAPTAALAAAAAPFTSTAAQATGRRSFAPTSSGAAIPTPTTTQRASKSMAPTYAQQQPTPALTARKSTSPVSVAKFNPLQPQPLTSFSSSPVAAAAAATSRMSGFSFPPFVSSSSSPSAVISSPFDRALDLAEESDVSFRPALPGSARKPSAPFVPPTRAEETAAISKRISIALQQQQQQQRDEEVEQQQQQVESAYQRVSRAAQRRFSDRVTPAADEAEAAESPSPAPLPPLVRAHHFFRSLLLFLLRTCVVGLIVLTVLMLLQDGKIIDVLLGRGGGSNTMFRPSNPHEPLPLQSELPPGQSDFVLCPPHAYCTGGAMHCIASEGYVRQGDVCVLNSEAYKAALSIKETAIEVLEKRLGDEKCGYLQEAALDEITLKDKVKQEMTNQLAESAFETWWIEGLTLLRDESVPPSLRHSIGVRVVSIPVDEKNSNFVYMAVKPHLSLQCQLTTLITQWMWHIIAISITLSLISYIVFMIRRWRSRRLLFLSTCASIRLRLSENYDVDYGSGRAEYTPLAIAHMREEFVAAARAAHITPDSNVWNQVVAELNKDSRIEKSKCRFGNTEREAWTWTGPTPQNGRGRQQ